MGKGKKFPRHDEPDRSREFVKKSDPGEDMRRYENESGTWVAGVVDGKLDWKNAKRERSSDE